MNTDNITINNINNIIINRKTITDFKLSEIFPKHNRYGFEFINFMVLTTENCCFD